MTTDNRQLESELRSTSERLRDFTEAASDWFFELDVQLRFTYLSGRHGDIVGIQPESMIGKSYIEAHEHIRLPAEEDRWRGQFVVMQEKRNWSDFTFTINDASGEQRIISNSAKAIYDEHGEFAGYRGVGRDITTKAHNEARLTSILNVVPDAIVTTADTGRIISFSTAAERLFGYTANEVVGRNVSLLMPSPYREEHDGYVARYRETGEKRIIGIGRRVEARRKDGTVFPINLAVNEMTIGGNRMFTGVIQDVSELLKAQSLNNRLGQILDRSLNEIYIFDAETLRFVQVNQGGRNNIGYSSDELSRMNPTDIKPEMTTAKFEELVAPLRNGEKELLEFEAMHRRKDGSTYPVEAHLQLMADETPPVFVAIIMDVTEAKRREAQLRQAQKMEAIGQLTGGIAHDFNNLLTIILGNNELLADTLDAGSRQRRLLDAASGAAQRGAQLTGQLLSFARQQPLEPKIIIINDLVSEMLDMLRRTLGEAIELRTQFANDLGRSKVDPAQLHNALLNLAINARDAMPDGGCLTIETSNVDLDEDAARERVDVEPGHYVRLSVRDTGIGIPPELQARVFEPFFTTKEQGKGTGLGLSMVHGFAKQSGGHVDIYSELGHGTAISLYLPDAEDHAERKSAPEPTSTCPQAGGETILVVEDDAGVRETVTARLDHLGYRFIEAQNGHEALEVLASGAKVDVLLTDMIMSGGMTGAELVGEVKRKYPHMKVIISSGYAEDRNLPTDGTPWLRKPYTLMQLAQTLRELLD